MSDLNDTSTPVLLPDSQRYRRMFDESRTAAATAEVWAKKARRYYDDDQLDPKTKRILARRKQPETIRNRIKPAVNGLLGMLEQNQTDPRAYPRNPEQEQGADVATKVLMYVADASRWKRTKLACAKNHFIEGSYGALIEFVEGKVAIRGIPYEEFFADPRSRMPDYSDAKWLGCAKWMYSDDVASTYPHFSDQIGNIAANGFGSALGMFEEDKPNNTFAWIDKKLKRVLVVEMYERDGGEWTRIVFFAGGILDKHASEYVDILADGSQVTRCPLEGGSCFVEGETLARYGVVKTMLSLQDEINARASRSLHLANSRQVQLQDFNAPPVDPDTVRIEAARADGVLPPGYGALPTSDMQAGNAQIMAEAISQLDRLAPTPAALAQGSQDSSGRSKLVAQQAGSTELTPALGELADFEHRVLTSAWKCARQYMTEPQYVRITKDAKSYEFVKVNDPVMGDKPAPAVGPDGQPLTDPFGQPVMQMQHVQVGVNNRLLEIDVDIDVETTPDTANLAAETFAALLQQSQLGVAAYGPKAWFDALWFLNPMPEKAEVREILEQGAQQMAQQQQAAQSAAAQEAQQKGAMEAAKTGAGIRLTDAQATHQTVLAAREAVGAQHDPMQTQIKVLDALSPPPAPQQPAPFPQ